MELLSVCKIMYSHLNVLTFIRMLSYAELGSNSCNSESSRNTEQDTICNEHPKLKGKQKALGENEN